MPNFEIRKNEQFDSLEVIFSGKPSEAVRSALKEKKFRWNRARGLWYGYAEESDLLQALTSAGESGAVSAPVPAGKIDLSGLDGLTLDCHGSELAAVIRADLKKRGATGCTVRSSRATYDTVITVTIKLSENDFRSVDELVARFGWLPFFRAQSHGVTVSGVYYHLYGENNITCGDDEHLDVLKAYYRERLNNFDLNSLPVHITEEYLPELTSAALERVSAITKIANARNYDRSDSYTDYYDVGYYLDIVGKNPADHAAREEMTDAEKETVAADLARKEAEEKARLEEMERQREEDRKAAEAWQKKHAADRQTVLSSLTVKDVPEAEQYFITDLQQGIGKECSLQDLQETIADREKRHKASRIDAKIAREVHFQNAEALKIFCDSMFLDDFDFLEGMGGTATDDPRVTDDNINQLTTEQRERVKFYSCDCIAVYLDGEVKLIIDPHGYSYARYVFLPSDATERRSALEPAPNAEPFYIPETVEKQAENLIPGDTVTMFQTDGMFCNIVHKYNGVVSSIAPGKYAQYNGVYIDLQSGRKSIRLFIRDHNDCLIYSGSLPDYPENLRYLRTWNSGSATMMEWADSHEQISRIANYYKQLGAYPVIDTVSR